MPVGQRFAIISGGTRVPEQWGFSMQKLLRVLITALSVSLLAPAPASAGDKPPTLYDNIRDGFVSDGRQNYPFVLRGVAIEWDKSCKSGKAADCLKLGKAFEGGFGALAADQRAAVGYYMLACKRGAGEGCTRAAEMLREGTPGYTLPDLARQQVEIGCNQLKHQPSCASLAVSQASAAGPASANGEALLAQACTGGDDAGCRMRANVLFYQRGDAASRGEALKLFEPACKARKAWGCMGMADAYANGWGVTRDPARAGEYQRTGCLDSNGDKLRLCTLYGTRLVTSRNQKDLNLGEQILNASCHANDGLACYQLGQLGLAPPAGATTTIQEAMYYARRGCELGEAGACSVLGGIYAGSSTEVDSDPAAAIALLDRGCSLGDQAACRLAAQLVSSDPQLRQRVPAINPAAPAAEQLRRAEQAVTSGNQMEGLQAIARLMHEGNEDAEWLLGSYMYYGLPGVFGDERRADALVLFENAARVGHVDAAIFMGMAYWYGREVPEDQAKALNYMSIAAARGSAEAGAIRRSMLAEPARQEQARRQREYAEWEAQRREYWATHPPINATWSAPSSIYNPAPTGRSVSQIYDEANFNNAISYYSGGTSVCAAGNRYC